MFISFEGGEGSGKSTAIKTIVDRLQKRGYDVLLTREPGGTPISEEIREVILNNANTDMDPMTEALLFAAARRQHVVECIKPALKEGKIVLCDRYVDSSLAYQGAARGLGVKKVYDINMYATEGLLPDITIFFDISPEQGLERISEHASSREINRLDTEKIQFHESVRKAFKDLAKEYPERYVIIDASLSPEAVAEEAYSAIEKRLG
jgi:dTMP kinase